MSQIENVESNKVNVNKKRSMIYKMCTMALMTAVICILAPLSIPIGTVPISFTNLAILFTLYLLGWKMGTASSVLYILIGLIGLPVFSGFTGGIGKLAGPTGGYIIGFIPMAIIAGIVIKKTNNIFLQYLSMVIGTIVLYAIGTAWFCVVMDTTVMTALSICVFVFIPGDLIKMVIAAGLGNVIRKRLKVAGLID